MRDNTVGGDPTLELLLQQQLLLQYPEQEQEHEERRPIVRGVSWLSEAKVDPSGVPHETRDWTCPRCRSHRCIRMNPGDSGNPTFCCAVCGYVFHGARARFYEPHEPAVAQ